jgi:cation-transporting P-type ATPase E
VAEEMTGLTGAEVAERVRLGRTNAVKEASSRSLAHIIRANVFTRFNAILGTLLVLILIFGQLRDALFGLVILVNTLIGIVQELRAKRTLDRLSLLSAPRARVIRDGVVVEVALGEVVLDDVMELRSGDQLVVDAQVLESDGLEVDESLLTGEAAPVFKSPGDELLSGSFVAAGHGRCSATRVGADSYAAKLASEAKQYTVVRSELRDSINTILRVITYIMIPVGSLLLAGQLRHSNGFGSAIPGTVAGLVGMVPEGLVLLTSVAFAVSAITLGRRKVLVQELPAVEGLARVDVVCLDKTGTLTEGDLVFHHVAPLGSEEGLEEVLAAFAAEPSARNNTLVAIHEAFPEAPDWPTTQDVPFSSARKWSARGFGDRGMWVLGAPEILLKSVTDPGDITEQVTALASDGYRVLLLASARGELSHETLPSGLRPAALVVVAEKIRGDAKETLGYFQDQGVTIKVISGDNPATVGAVATRAGVPDVGTPVDARGLPEDPEELAEVVEKTTVFGRVTPVQKEAMVMALQSKGHVVAMTGDGVNDVLALKKADIGIAMGSGSPATRAVAELVLVDGRFQTLPGVVAEGRRVMGNMERVANLFLTKTVYATILSIAIGLAGWTFIFLPRHLTLISALTIGIPAFVLSFAPNKQRYRPGFVKRVMRFVIPAGLVAAAAGFTAAALAHVYGYINLAEARTMATLAVATVGFMVLIIQAQPFNWWRALLVMSMITAFAIMISVPYFQAFFALDLPDLKVIAQTLVVAGAAVVGLELLWRYTGSRRHRLEARGVE